MDEYDEFVLKYFNIFNYAIINIETIALGKWRTHPPKGSQTHIHNCIRKVDIILRNKDSRVFEFHPCLKKGDLTRKERSTFYWCQKNIHGLEYYPKKGSDTCAQAIEVISDYLKLHDVEVCLYKGHLLQKEICQKMDISSVNIGLNIPKAQCHNSKVHFYHSELQKLPCG